MKYGLDLTLNEIDSDADCAAVVDRFLPGLRDKLGQNPQARGLSLRKLAQYTGGLIPQQALDALDKALQELGRSAGGYTAAEKAKILRYSQILEQDKARAKAAGRSLYAWENVGRKPQTPAKHHQNAIEPGKPFLDTEGKRIQAHGGAIFHEGGVYYWYGENKEHTDGGKSSTIWTFGIRCYRSEDLMNFEDLGLIIPPVLDDPDSCLFPDKRVDRPHIFKNESTGKYVAWLKLSGNEACFAVLTADALTGPYELQKENYRPLGKEVGDFDIVIDKETGKHYLYLVAGHEGVATLEISEDGLSADKLLTMSYTGLFPPFVREGIAMAERDGKKYMFSSGMTGYIPNQSDCAAAQSWTEPFMPVGDPYPSDDSLSSFNSQFTQIYRLPGEKEQYIALSDRWVPGYPMDREKEELFRRVIASHSAPDRYSCTEEERKIVSEAPSLESADTSAADYVWLPVRFEGKKPVIEWTDRWVPEMEAAAE